MADKKNGDQTEVGDVSDSKGIAVGPGAKSEVHETHYHYDSIEQPAGDAPYLALTLPPHHVPRLVGEEVGSLDHLW